MMAGKQSHLAALGGMAQRIAQQVVQHPVDLLTVEQHARQRRLYLQGERDVLFGGRREEALTRALQ